MRAGTMRHEAVIFTRSSTVDAYGDVESSSYTEHSRHQCALRSRTLRERTADGELLSRTQFELIFHYDVDLELLDPSAEVEVAGRRLVVQTTVDPNGRRQSVQMLAEDKT